MRNRDEECKDNPLSSRIKDLYIELHGYSFFHGPSEIRKIDQRFIGRIDNRNKLKAILTDSETRTGAYLVTGYRGMGKSSYVNKVIDDIDPSRPKQILSSIYRRIFAVLVLLYLMDILFARFFGNALAIVIGSVIFASGLALYLTDRDRDERKVGIPTGYWKYFRLPGILLGSFCIGNRINSGNLFRKWIQILFVSFSIYGALLVLGSRYHFQDSHRIKLAVLFLLHISFFVFNFFYREIKAKGKEFDKTATFRDKFKKTVFKDILRKIGDYFNYSKRRYITLNLGYDDLKEIDILRLVSRNIQREYEHLKKNIRLPELGFKLLKLGLVLFFMAGLYSIPDIYSLNHSLKEKIGICKYFPSQRNMTVSKDIKEYRASLNLSELNSYPSEKGTLKKRPFLRIVTTYADKLLHIAFFELRAAVPVSNRIKKNILPKRIDYLFWIFFAVFYWLINRFLFTVYFKSPQNRKILKQLNELNDLIDSQVTDEEENRAGVGTDKAFAFSMQRKRNKAYPRADIREIEKRLITILKDIDQHGRFSAKTEFIFIFDELDKIEPNMNVTVQEREAKDAQDSYQLETTFFSTEGVRERQHTIFKILSNLKHFLNTAKAKFIFIAGREMYDAALADVSDRNFFIGSIFHKVIYVPSFLTDTSDRESANLLSMTEEYVCQFLFPAFFTIEGYNLKEYRKYLENVLYPIETRGDKGGENNEKNWLRQAKIDKIIFTLRQFIVYLTYRSNGAPKKMTTLFESYIYKPDPGKEIPDSKLNSPLNLRVGFNNRNLYLEFGAFHQYSFEMITYLITPVYLSLSDAIKSYGDKLLVSTTFLVDHLYKFHKSAFSMRNIELTPEIIDINKAPQLRDLISMIINNLANSHLTDIVSGLFLLKFYKKISEEISFLSKVDEQEAAAFNFSLDASLALKRHYKKILKEAKQNANTTPGNLDYMNPVSFLHMISGDFHYYDEEYNEAILEYMEAVKGMRKLKFKPSMASLFIDFTRNMLKLGLTLEKRKSYYSASMIYGELISKVTTFMDNESVKLDGIRLIYQPLLAKLHVIEKSHTGGITQKDLGETIQGFQDIKHLHKNRERFLVEVEFWSKIGDLLYYKNRTKEKGYGNQDSWLSPWDKLPLWKHIEKKIDVSSEAWRYYMMGLGILCGNYLNIQENDISEKKLLPSITGKLLDYEASIQNTVVNRVMARILSAIGDCYYSCAKTPDPGKLEKFLSVYFLFVEEPGEWFGEIFTAEPKKTNLTQEERKELLKMQAGVFEKFEPIEKALIYYYLSYKFYFKAANQKQASVQMLKILYVIRNLLSLKHLKCPEKDPDGKECQNGRDEGTTVTEKIDVIMRRGIRTLYRAYGSIHRLEIEEYKDLYSDVLPGKEPIPLENISLSSDIREYILAAEEILLACDKERLFKEGNIHKYIREHSITPYSSINRMYNRIIELRFKAKVLFKIFSRLGFEPIFGDWIDRPNTSPNGTAGNTNWEKRLNIRPGDPRIKHVNDLLMKRTSGADFDKASFPDVLEFLITDSIYCLQEIIKLAHIFGGSYMVNYSILADAYKKLGYWCEVFLCYCKVYNGENKKNHPRVLGIRKKLECLIGPDNLKFVTPRYNYEKAREAYYAVEDLHRGGKTYRQFTENMFYLNDDFNDSWYHFCAAGERYRIKAGVLKCFRKDLIDKIKKSSIYDFRNYSNQKEEIKNEKGNTYFNRHLGVPDLFFQFNRPCSRTNPGDSNGP